jgi:hypothetical protein
MLILPNKLIRYTGATVIDDNKDTMGELIYCIPNNMKKLMTKANQYVIYIPYNCKYTLASFPGQPKTEEIDNSPQTFELLARSYKSQSWLVKSNGFITEMDDYTFCDAVLLGLQDKKFNCEFVWVYDSGKMRLVVKDSDIYQKAKSETDIRKCKIIKPDKLEFGGIYEDLLGRHCLYLGSQNIMIDKSVGSWPNTSWIKQTVNKKIYILAGYKDDNINYLSLQNLSFGYRSNDFKARKLITKLNITIQDVKDFIKQSGKLDLEFV